MSTPRRCASRCTACVVLTPSATMHMDEADVLPGSHRPEAQPDLTVAGQIARTGEHEVPEPGKPHERRRPSPKRHTKAGWVSARPRVTSAALAFSPKPSPSLRPAAMAMTFLIAPPSSTPGTSVLE